MAKINFCNAHFKNLQFQKLLVEFSGLIATSHINCCCYKKQLCVYILCVQQVVQVLSASLIQLHSSEVRGLCLKNDQAKCYKIYHIFGKQKPIKCFFWYLYFWYNFFFSLPMNALFCLSRYTNISIKYSLTKLKMKKNHGSQYSKNHFTGTFHRE